jgi:hypothetical protein
MAAFIRYLRLLVVLLSVTLALTGCGTFIQSSVTVFHELSPTAEAKTYAFIRSKEQQESLEHKAYEEMVRQQLARREFREVSVAQADLAVFLSYQIDNGREVVSSYPLFGQTGVASSYTYGNIYRSYGGYSSYSGTTTYTPTYGIVGTETTSDTVYTRKVQLDMLNRPLLDQGRVSKVYEGKVVSSGSSGQLNRVMPYLIQSLLQDFPGNSGTTKTVTLPFQRQ